MKARLEWRQKSGETSWHGYSGDTPIAVVCPERRNGPASFSIYGINVTLQERHSECSSLSLAHRTVDKIWSKWLEHSGLMEKPKS